MTANLFAYGLLKSDGPLAYVSRALGEFKAEVRSADPHFNLFSLGYAPGIVGGDHYLLGELWEMKPTAFDFLDRLEYGYQRREIPFKGIAPNDIGEAWSGRAWLYFYAAPTEGHTIRDRRIVLSAETNQIMWDNRL